jgi:hypothetical protein
VSAQVSSSPIIAGTWSSMMKPSKPTLASLQIAAAGRVALAQEALPERGHRALHVAHGDLEI